MKYKSPPRKRKRRTYHLSVLPFGFLSPFPLERCVYRLQEVQEIRDIAFSPHIKLDLLPLDTDACEFRVLEYEPASIEIVGLMEIIDGRATVVRGEVRLSAVIALELVAAALLIGMLSHAVSLTIALLFYPALGWFIWRYWIGLKDERDRLARLIHGVLNY